VRRLFNYTEAMERVIGRAVAGMPAFAHVDPEHILVACTQARVDTRHGMLAKRGQVVGTFVPMPRLIPVEEESA